MAYRKRPLSKHLKRAMIWLIAACIFGMAPLLFLQLINLMSEENLVAKEINHVIEDKLILFVACTMMGSVVMDFILSKFKVRGWPSIFAIYISPFCILVYLFLKYLLVYLKYADIHEFGPGSVSTWLIVGFSMIYCLFVKTIYYIKQENAR